MITYSHRGYYYKENTIESFKEAFNYFDGIELDVRLTRDNIPVIIHDYKINEINLVIHLNNYEQLIKYNILTLDEILNLVYKNNKKCLIDIKVPSNSKFIIKYLKEKIDSNNYLKNIFYCIVYTDNIIFYDNIKILRAYNTLIPKNININFYGVAIRFKDTILSMKTIINFLKNYPNHHLNIYLQYFESNIGKLFILNLVTKYTLKISLTSDNII